MKKLKVILSVFICQFAMMQAQAQTTMEEFVAKWENSKAFTLETVDKMPDDLLDYKPHESAMSFKEQVTHIGAVIASIKNWHLQKGNDVLYLRKL